MYVNVDSSCAKSNWSLDYDTDSDLTKHSDQLAEYDRYMARELPRLVRVELETAVLGASSSLESGLQAQLIDIIRNCQRQVFETYATELNPQAPATITVTGSVINDPAPLIAPPEDNALADINAFFPPPAFPDNNSPSPNEYALTDSNEWSCPITYSDSGYGSQRVNTRNGGERLWQNSFFTGHLADEDSDILSQLLPYDVSTDLPQVKDAESTYMEPCWDLSGFDSTHAQG